MDMLIRWFLPAFVRMVAAVNGVSIAGAAIGGCLMQGSGPASRIAHRKATGAVAGTERVRRRKPSLHCHMG